MSKMNVASGVATMATAWPQAAQERPESGSPSQRRWCDRVDGLGAGADVLIGIDAEAMSWDAPAEISTDPSALDGRNVLVS